MQSAPPITYEDEGGRLSFLSTFTFRPHTENRSGDSRTAVRNAANADHQKTYYIRAPARAASHRTGVEFVLAAMVGRAPQRDPF
jgi:hypothetical protein